jgi:hypothetical protein
MGHVKHPSAPATQHLACRIGGGEAAGHRWARNTLRWPSSSRCRCPRRFAPSTCRSCWCPVRRPSRWRVLAKPAQTNSAPPTRVCIHLHHHIHCNRLGVPQLVGRGVERVLVPGGAAAVEGPQGAVGGEGEGGHVPEDALGGGGDTGVGD